MSISKQIIKIITPKKIKNFFGNEAVKLFKQEQVFSTLSYAQEGEDLLLNRFLENKSSGFYIDIGAHHPKRFSNTYLFYKKGWRGINIDAMPNSMTVFKKERPRDINLEIGISGKAEELIYYMFNEPALNTFSGTEANKKNGFGTYEIIRKKKIKTFPLKDVISKHIELNQTIDFMTIDVEGLDLDVLKSNDWKVYRPSLLLVEDLEKQSLRNLFTESELFTYLTSLNYELVAKTFNTLFFKDYKTK